MKNTILITITILAFILAAWTILNHECPYILIGCALWISLISIANGLGTKTKKL